MFLFHKVKLLESLFQFLFNQKRIQGKQQKVTSNWTSTTITDVIAIETHALRSGSYGFVFLSSSAKMRVPIENNREICEICIIVIVILHVVACPAAHKIAIDIGIQIFSIPCLWNQENFKMYNSKMLLFFHPQYSTAAKNVYILKTFS